MKQTSDHLLPRKPVNTDCDCGSSISPHIPHARAFCHRSDDADEREDPRYGSDPTRAFLRTEKVERGGRRKRGVREERRVKKSIPAGGQFSPRTHKFAHHPNLLPFLSSKISTKYPPTPRSRPFLLPSSPYSRLTTEKKLNLLHFPSPSRCKHYREKMLENHLDHPRPSISSVSRPSTPSSPRPPPPCIIFVVELLPRSSIPLSVVSPFLTSSDSSPPLFLRLAVRTFP